MGRHVSYTTHTTQSPHRHTSMVTISQHNRRKVDTPSNTSVTSTASTTVLICLTPGFRADGAGALTNVNGSVGDSGTKHTPLAIASTRTRCPAGDHVARCCRLSLCWLSASALNTTPCVPPPYSKPPAQLVQRSHFHRHKARGSIPGIRGTGLPAWQRGQHRSTGDGGTSTPTAPAPNHGAAHGQRPVAMLPCRLAEQVVVSQAPAPASVSQAEEPCWNPPRFQLQHWHQIRPRPRPRHQHQHRCL